MIIATKYAADKVKSSAIGCFSSIYSAALYHFDSVHRSRNKECEGYPKHADIAKCEAQKIGGKFKHIDIW